jgi:tetratricopeptide (TPR) repeat protein
VKRRALWGAIVVALTVTAYVPALRGSMVWDDDAHVTRPELRSWHGLERIWFDLGATQQYYPLTHAVFWVEHRLWGDAPLGYHAASLILHLAAAGLVASILHRLKAPGAGLAAAVFALHPVHVESVAWITELKNTLSAVLFLASLRVYLTFDETRRVASYAAASVLFVLALLSKSVTATLPGALLVVFWWRRGRLSWTRDVRPLLPWICCGVVSGLFTAWVERTLIGARGEPFALTAFERSLLAGRVVWFYMGKLFWPTGLVFVYPRWDVRAWSASHAVYPLGVLVLVVAAWLLRTRWRAPLAGVLLFIGGLFPVLGFFNVYPFLFSFVADHFQYLPSLGVITVASAGIALGRERLPPRARWVGQAAIAALLGVLAVLSWRQCGSFRDVETLYTRTLARNPACWMAHCNLGEVLAAEGRPDEALIHDREALRLRPAYPEAHNNLGNLLSASGRTDEAIGEFEEAVRLRPDFVEALSNLGLALTRAGRWQEAIERYTRALAIEPDHVEAHYNLGIALLVTGNPREAIGHLERMLRARPDHIEARFNLGSALLLIGNTDEAMEQFRTVLRARPDDPEAHFNLGLALSSAGRAPEAIAEYERALALKPDYENARMSLERERDALHGGRKLVD